MRHIWNRVRSFFVSRKELERLRERYWHIRKQAGALRPSKTEAAKAFLIKSVVKPRDDIKVYIKLYYPIYSPYPTDKDGEECEFPTPAEEAAALREFIGRWDADSQKKHSLVIGTECRKNGHRLGNAEELPAFADYQDETLKDIYLKIYQMHEKEFDEYAVKG